MKGLLNSNTQRVKRRQLPPSRKVAGWAQVALMMWMVSWGSPLLEYIAAGSGLDRLHRVQPGAIAAGEPSSRERVNIQGPDLNGIYGGLQGTGGIEAVYNQSAEATTTLLNDTYGHTELTDNGTTFTWNPSLTDGYGVLSGSIAPSSLNNANDLASVLGWRGHVIDPTGDYYLGARYYAPDSGSFLSPDPLGHAASMDLYSFCNGDPVNNFDPDGRFSVGAVSGQSYNDASSVGAILGGTTQITQATQMASSLIQSYQGNLQMFGGNQYNAINATVNPAYTAIAKYNEAADGIGYSYNNLGSSLSTSQRAFSGFQSAMGAVSTVGVGFGGAGLATASGITAPVENFAANSYLRAMGGSGYVSSYVEGTARLNITLGGQNLFRAANTPGDAAFGNFASVEMPVTPQAAIEGNALNPLLTKNRATSLYQVQTRFGLSVEGKVAPQGAGYPGLNTQVFQSSRNGLPTWRSTTPMPYLGGGN